MGLCRTTGCKVTSCQNWGFEKNSATLPKLNPGSLGSAERQIVFQTSNESL